jgi:TonB family protein
MRRRFFLFVSGFLALAGVASPQAFDVEKALALPVTPGAIALLVEHTSDQRVKARLAEGLKDARPEVRAAAARVVNAASIAALVPNVVEALAMEPDAGAGTEMAMAVAGYPDSEGVVLGAARKLGIASDAARILAAVSGLRVLDVLPALREMNPNLPLASVLRIASRGDLVALVRVATVALREKDGALWDAYLQVVRESNGVAIDGFLSVAITLDELRQATLWHALASGTQLAVPDEPILETESAFLAELLARRGGRQRVESQAWIAARREGGETRLAAISEPSSNSLLLLLTKNERRAIAAQTHHDEEAFEDWHQRAEDAREEKLRPAEEVPDAPLRTVSHFPTGFVASLLQVTACAPEGATGIGSADMEFTPAGRPRRIAFDPSPLPDGCAAASRALLINSVVPPERLSGEPDRDTLLVLAEPNFLACLSAPLFPRTDLGKGPIVPPNRVTNVNPVYPPSAKNERVSGMVVLEASITSSGCVRDLQALHSPDSRLTLASIVAVSRWRYEPTRLAGTPVPIVMTITVNFGLN